jgi:hypothetical protein
MCILIWLNQWKFLDPDPLKTKIFRPGPDGLYWFRTYLPAGLSTSKLAFEVFSFVGLDPGSNPIPHQDLTSDTVYI